MTRFEILFWVGLVSVGAVYISVVHENLLGTDNQLLPVVQL